jgi:hypothetical protein
MNVTLTPLYWAQCRIHPLNSHLNITRSGADEEAVTHATASAAPKAALGISTLLRHELDPPGEALTTRHRLVGSVSKWLRQSFELAPGPVREAKNPVTH